MKIADRLRRGADGDDYSYYNSRDLRDGANAIDLLESALTRLVDRYTMLVNCGDCGNWDPEKEPDVIFARAALAKLRGEA